MRTHDEYLSLAEAAKFIPCSPQYLRKLVRQGIVTYCEIPDRHSQAKFVKRERIEFVKKNFPPNHRTKAKTKKEKARRAAREPIHRPWTIRVKLQLKPAQAALLTMAVGDVDKWVEKVVLDAIIPKIKDWELPEMPDNLKTHEWPWDRWRDTTYYVHKGRPWYVEGETCFGVEIWRVMWGAGMTEEGIQMFPPKLVNRYARELRNHLLFGTSHASIEPMLAARLEKVKTHA